MSDTDETNPLEGFWMEGDSLAPPCQAEMDVISVILSIANISSNSTLYDLGCGDGRVCIEATRRYNAKSVGVEIEEHLYNDFKRKIEELELSDKVTAILGDLREVDLSPATVVVLYLLPEAIECIRDKLDALLERGCLLICNTWGPKHLTCSKRVTCGPYNNVDLLVYDKTSISS